MLPHEPMDVLKSMLKDKVEELKEELREKIEEELSELADKIDPLVLKVNDVCDEWIERRMLDIETLTPEVDPQPPEEKQPR